MTESQLWIVNNFQKHLAMKTAITNTISDIAETNTGYDNTSILRKGYCAMIYESHHVPALILLKAFERYTSL